MFGKRNWSVRDTGKKVDVPPMTAEQFAKHLKRYSPSGMAFSVTIKSDSEVRVVTDVRITTYVGKR